MFSKIKITGFIIFFFMVHFSGHGLASAVQVFSIPVSRDTGISSVGKEKTANNGWARKIKLKGSQEYILMDIDPEPLKGSLIKRARLHVCSASPETAPFLRVGVSAVASAWQEGTSFWYFSQTGSACFSQAAYKQRDWAIEGGSILDVIFGHGHTLWKSADASAPDPGGWQTVPVDPDIVAARVAGLSFGFCLWDEVGTTWSCGPGGFERQLFPNRYCYSKEKKNKAPWLEVVIEGKDEQPPEAVFTFT